jgi:hypothetical protein
MLAARVGQCAAYKLKAHIPLAGMWCRKLGEQGIRDNCRTAKLAKKHLHGW